MTETLKDLLQQAMTKRDVRSGRALAELTSKREHKIDRTQVNQILGGTYTHKPTTSLIEAVAWLAGVSREKAYAAAGRELPGAPFVDLLPPEVDDLTPPQRRAVITVIRAFLGSAEEEAGEGRDRPAAKTEAPEEGADNVRQFPAAARRSAEVPGLKRQADKQDAEAEMPDPPAPDDGL